MHLHPGVTPIKSQVYPVAPFSELELIVLHNLERSKIGISRLSLDPKLSSLAMLRANHAATMALDGMHLHDGFGADVAAVFASVRTGENAAMGQVDAKEVMVDWMGSAGHRAAIVDRGFSVMGAGRATSKDGITYWFTIFAGAEL
jgi:uncharacterized protein YkwD